MIFETKEFTKDNFGFGITPDMKVDSIRIGTEADDLEIDYGWSVLKLDGKRVSYDEFQEITSTKESFDVTFQVLLHFLRLYYWVLRNNLWKTE